MRKVRNTIGLLMAVCLISVILPCFAAAQQQKVIELTYGTPYGVDHPFSVVDRKWMAKVEKETNGRVKFKPYWGGAVIGGRDAVEELTQGAIDMAFINPSTSKSGFQILRASYLFFYGVTNLDVGAKIWKEMLAKFPEIEQEYKDMKVLCWGGSLNQLITRKPVRKIDDLKGMRIKVVGDISNALKELGVEGISISNAEIYVGLQKGIFDGLIGPTEGLESLKLADVAKYVTMINWYRTHGGMRMMNLKKFNSLPPDIRKVFENNIEYYSRETDAYFTWMNSPQSMDVARKLGVEFITLSKEDMAKFYAPIKPMALKEAQDLDLKGLPGTKIYNEAQRLIAQYNAAK
ncbi:MAG TPA: TRAP transporter substrate-binding protein DctP [Syntrophorhabdaceae bacterium]|nr:TRAP transporter substrate-binding protein DctP [Syntrophorhabdaceae bacterium]